MGDEEVGRDILDRQRPIWLWILIWLYVDLSPQQNDLDPQRIRSPPSYSCSRCNS